MIKTIDQLYLLVFSMQRLLHTKSDIGDCFDILSNNWIVLGIWDEIGLGLYLVELAGLNSKVLSSLHGLSLIP